MKIGTVAVVIAICFTAIAIVGIFNGGSISIHIELKGKETPVIYELIDPNFETPSSMTLA